MTNSSEGGLFIKSLRLKMFEPFLSDPTVMLVRENNNSIRGLGVKKIRLRSPRSWIHPPAASNHLRAAEMEAMERLHPLPVGLATAAVGPGSHPAPGDLRCGPDRPRSLAGPDRP